MGIPTPMEIQCLDYRETTDFESPGESWRVLLQVQHLSHEYQRRSEELCTGELSADQHGYRVSLAGGCDTQVEYPTRVPDKSTR